MTDAVKMAIDALTDIRTSIECAAGCDEGIAPMAAVSEIMSAYGTAMASAYSRAADMVNILAALEQAGEPVADDWGTPPDPDGHMSKNAVVEALDMMVEHWVQGTRPTDEQGRQATAALMSLNREPPLPTLQRLGQEFDAGEGLARRVAETMDEDGGCWSACSGCQEGVDGCVSARDYPYSPIFKCQPGSGCRECGGIGVTWMDGAFLAGYDEALSVPPQSRVAAEPVGLREALEGIDDTLKRRAMDFLYRLDELMGKPVRTGPIAEQAMALIAASLATPSQPDPQSREPSDNQIDAAKAKAMDEAADFCIQTLAKALGVDDWEQADGSETWDGDVAGTIYNILKAGRVYDDEDGRVARLEDDPQSRGQAFDGEGEVDLREAVEHLLTVGEFCRTDDTESALRKVRAALSSAKRGEEG